MTKRDFFRIIIKLFGLYSIILSLFYFIPSNLSYLNYGFEPLFLIYVFGSLIITILIFVLLLRKTDLIIDILKLDKGFDDDIINFGNFNSNKIFYLSLILLGGYLILNYIPEFLEYTFLAFKETISKKGFESQNIISFGSTTDYFNWVISGINLIVGYVLLTNYERITKWLNRNNNLE